MLIIKNKNRNIKKLIIGLSLTFITILTFSAQAICIPEAKNEIVLYYSKQCQHCQEVEAFLAQNGLTNQTSLVQKEITAHPENQNELVKIAKKHCKTTGNMINLPVLWDGSTCIVGDNAIMSFLKEKYNVKTSKK
jgi:hypothetical protein